MDAPHRYAFEGLLLIESVGIAIALGEYDSNATRAVTVTWSDVDSFSSEPEPRSSDHWQQSEPHNG
jgi:hypothetical protein